ncbi:hypothetical protein DES53_102819 [Roseimicrobium gellanilyticum]|uniref:Uncharacterized protein n=1 Tax=Roseimicrobium gellanilyticum TaxID=748857 RepID=A0A366HTL2_9BACT|nr:hypothetical protein DES53_102819 [Roseimicrobium gellanilyticum]
MDGPEHCDAKEVSRSHTVLWVFSIVAMFVLYLLTAPPVYFRALSKDPKHVSWMTTAYIRPYAWLSEKTPLKVPLDAYSRMWRNRFLGKR